MVAKNIKGKSFGGCVRYVMSGSAELLETEGVFADSTESMIRSFVVQQSHRADIKQPVGHIPIAFSAEDSHRLSNDFMLQLAKEYMHEMGIGNTQYIIARHNNTNHPHLHIVYNRIDNDLKLISVNNDYKRNVAVCKKLKDRHGLTYGKGKEQVNRPKLHGADRAKYEIYDAMKLAIVKSHDLTELSDNLKPHGVKLFLKYRSGTDIVPGVSFEKDGYKFKGSEIDRKFSYKGLHLMFNALTYLENKKREEQRIPTIKGVKLTQEQWQQLESGNSVWLENLHRKDGNGTFSAYATLSDDKTRVSFSKAPPQPQSTPSLVETVATAATSTAAEITSALGGLFDIPTAPSPTDTQEEADFRRQMQRKKKKGIRF